MSRLIPILGKQYLTPIHLFSDASFTGVCTVAYAVVNQQNVFSQNLITSKSRSARKNSSLPLLELVAVHMSANLAENVKTCLNYRKIYAGSDSTIVLHWLKDSGECSSFSGWQNVMVVLIFRYYIH